MRCRPSPLSPCPSSIASCPSSLLLHIEMLYTIPACLLHQVICSVTSLHFIPASALIASTTSVINTLPFFQTHMSISPMRLYYATLPNYFISLPLLYHLVSHTTMPRLLVCWEYVFQTTVLPPRGGSNVDTPVTSEYSKPATVGALF